MTWTWDDLVDMVCELMVENIEETHTEECYEYGDSASSLESIFESEFKMFLENIEDDVRKRWQEILERARTNLKKEE